MDTKKTWWEMVKEKTRPGINKKIREMTNTLLPKRIVRKNTRRKRSGYDPFYPPPYKKRR